jgi:hypothetical protein
VKQYTQVCTVRKVDERKKEYERVETRFIDVANKQGSESKGYVNVIRVGL